MNNVIEARPFDKIVRRVRIIWSTQYGKCIYVPSADENVVLTVKDESGDVIGESECVVNDDTIVAEFPILRNEGKYYYTLALYLDADTKFTFVDSEIIIGRGNMI